MLVVNSLSQYFDGVAMKTLSAVEADGSRSHQHEFQATVAMRSFLGAPEDATHIEATFMYFAGDEEKNRVEQSQLTLYNARRNTTNRSPEYRLYFKSNSATDEAQAGDLLTICRKHNKDVLVLICEQGSLAEYQIRQLFGEGASHEFSHFVVKDTEALTQADVSLPKKLLLEWIGETPHESTSELVDSDLVLSTFDEIPLGRDLSQFARACSTLELDQVGPDVALINWLEVEYESFRILESRALSNRLQLGFVDAGEADVDGFLQFAISVINRRKSRAGKSLEYHFEHLFLSKKILFSPQACTEGRNRPDFLFPGITQYMDQSFPATQLSFLGAKRTLKDRWRQILQEADRISFKYLATVDTAITRTQVDEIRSADVKLVVPTPISELYPQQMRDEFLSVSNFLDIVTDKQKAWL